jgi:hypothetical protein
VVLEGFNVTAVREPRACVPAIPVQNGPVPEVFVRGRPFDPCTFERYPALAIPSIGVEARF